MAVKVRTYSELLRELKKARNKALEGAGEKAVDLVKGRIDEDVYGKYDPSWYERTYQLRDSVDVTNTSIKKDIAEIEISHDTKKITTGNINNGQHASVVDGFSSHDSIDEIVHNGLTGAIIEEGYWKDKSWYKPKHTFAKPRPYMDNSIQKMRDGEYKKFMIEELRKMGYKVK